MTWGEPTTNFYDEATERRLKLAFAAALCRNPNNPYEAAREIEPTQSVGRANWIVANWMDDPLVVAAMGERIAELGGAKAGLPTKEELALKVFREADTVTDKNTKLAYFRVVADIMGYIQRNGGTNINNNVNVLNQPKIMRVPQYKDLKEWETQATDYQRQLASS